MIRGGLAFLAVVTLAGCSGSGSVSSHGSTSGVGATGRPSPTSTFVPTRWWSNQAGPAGGTIDPKHPDAAAKSLHPSQQDYCGMLKQTLAAGKSILPGVTSADPALLASTQAFVAELAAVAPAGVSGDWKTIGTAVVSLVKAGGRSSALGSLNVSAVQKAALAVAADARTSCGLDLSGAARSAIATPAK